MMKKSHSEGLVPDEALNLLDSVSDTFCLAKWKQVTLNLHTGTNSSCCLTPPSHIDLNDVQKNALVFHNTKENLKDRKELLDGIKTESCSFCWNQEDKSGKVSSERVYKSASPWASNYIDEVLDAKDEKLLNPSYLEVSFSNKCNLKCMYCNPQTSSSFYEEIKKFGPYSDSQNIGDLAEIEKRFNFTQSEEDNPYVKEFLNWFPDLVNSLKVIRFTGGEPLYSDGMYKCFEVLEDKSHKDLTIELNSNLSTSAAQISKLEKSLNKVTLFRKKRIVTSLDTWGNQSEYIRFGLSLDKFKDNFEYLLENMPELEFRITVTFNILSAFNFNSLLYYVLDLKRKYKTYDKILLSLYPLISPYHLSIKVLDEEASTFLEESLSIMQKYKISDNEPFGFNDYEIDSFKKIIDFYTDSYPKKLK
jgi:pyruvate-formate lyase-activating enzyme